MLQSHLDNDSLYESWSGILLSDVSVPSTVSDPTKFSSSSWKQRVLSCLVEDPEIFKQLPTFSTRAGVTEPVNVELEMNLDSLCERDGAAIPLLVSLAIEVIDLEEKPMYHDATIVEERIPRVLSPFPATGVSRS